MKSVLKPVSEYSFGNPEPLFGPRPNLVGLCLVTRGNFEVLEKCGKMGCDFMTSQKSFAEKSSNS